MNDSDIITCFQFCYGVVVKYNKIVTSGKHFRVYVRAMNSP